MTDSAKKERFQVLLSANLNSAFNLACWLTRSHQDAEDVVQEACLRAFRYFDGFHGDDPRAWLLAIVRNTFFTWHSEKRMQAHDTQFDEEHHSQENGSATQGDTDPEALLMHKEDGRLVRQALERLPLAYREVIVLREFEDLSYKQIAGIVDIPIGTVMSRLGRGRKMLATMLTAPSRGK